MSFVQEVSPVAKLSASCERHDDVHDHEDDDDDDKLMIHIYNGGVYVCVYVRFCLFCLPPAKLTVYI